MGPRVNKKFFQIKEEKTFSFFVDFDASENPTGARLNTLLDEIFTRITQDIFNESLAKW